MATDINISQLVINKLTQAQYQEAKEAGQIVETELYMITDGEDSSDEIAKVPASDTAPENPEDGTLWIDTSEEGNEAITPESIGAAPAYTYGTTDLTAGTSPLETGKLYFVYE